MVELPEMLEIPSGPALLGVPERPDDFAMPHRWAGPRQVDVPAFILGKFPVTRQEYEIFLDATGREAPLDWNDPSLGYPNLPACGVSWEDAQAFCKWLTKSTGKPFRLPSADEREKAARGGLAGKRFPWGDEDPVGRCCFAMPPEAAPAPVGSFPPNGYGLYDMAGNVWEWLNDLYTDVAPDPAINSSCVLTEADAQAARSGNVVVLRPGHLQNPGSGTPSAIVTYTGRSVKENKVLVSGSFMTPVADILWMAYRHEDPPDLRMRCLGFRVAL